MNLTSVAWILLIFISFMGMISYFEDDPICLEQVKVTKIIALDYRDATIQLEDGRKIKVNQTKLKVGDLYCTKYSKGG